MDELYDKVQRCKMLPFDGYYSNDLKFAILKMMTVDFKLWPSCEELVSL